jgi:DNA-binding CsgD family transcriptional regulator
MHVHRRIAADVARWLDSGVDVVVGGAAGSGRSTVLRQLAADRLAGHRPAVLLRGFARAREIPLGAFTLDPRWEPVARGGVGRLSASLEEVLDEPGAVLLVDGVDLLDRVSRAVVERLAETVTGLRLVVTESRPGPPRGGLRRTLARVEVPPLGIRGVTELVEEATGVVARPTLAARLASLSAGNPRIALGLLGAARVAGTVVVRDHQWVSVQGGLDAVDPSVLVDSWLPELPDGFRDSLVRLAWCGPLRVDDASAVVPPEHLTALAGSGVLVREPVLGDAVVSVSPPALALGLLLALTPEERARVEHDTGAGPGAGALDDPEPAGPLDDRSTDALLSTSAVTLLLGRLGTRRRVLHDAWRALPSLETALPLLRLVLTQDQHPEDVLDVAGTSYEAAPGRAELAAELDVLRDQWAIWDAARGASVPPELRVREGTTPPGRVVPVIERLRGGASVVSVARSLPDVDPGPASEEPALLLLRVAAALEEGRPADALLLLGDESADRTGFADQADALHGDALVLLGRLEDAEEWFTSRLSDARARLEPLAFRLACRGLATVRTVQGDPRGAWTALSAALRLGRSGPLTVSFDERVLGLASIARSRAGDPAMAEALLDELRRAPAFAARVLTVVEAWASAELRAASEEDEASRAARELWDVGRRHVDDGMLASALLTWSVLPAPMTPDELREFTDLARRVDVPLVRPAVRLQEALGQGTGAEIVTALRRYRVGGPVARAALRLAMERGDGKPWSPEALREAVGYDAWSLLATSSGPLLQPAAQLTAREREVLRMAKDGHTNTQIADRLFLSRRTVEHHVFRGLRKLGLNTRTQLADWDPLR